MRRWCVLAAAAALAGCGLDAPPGPVASDPRPQAQSQLQPQPRPQRIVSLDFCADQYVLKFVERDRILALSPDAEREFSYLRGQAAGLPTVRPTAEDVIVLEPDLVVRSYGGGPRAAAMFERAGIAVYNIERAEDMESILRAATETARALGSTELGLAVAAEMQAQLAALRVQEAGVTALYMTPGGVTSGPGSLIHEILAAAGLENFQARPGWGPIPLERLAYEQPDLIASAFHEDLANHPHAWSAIRHPVARAQLERGAVVPLDGAWTACGAWFAMDAVEALARGSGDLDRGAVNAD